jgi:hypothetical protein
MLAHVITSSLQKEFHLFKNQITTLKNPFFLQENYELQRFKEKWWKPQQCQVNKKIFFPQG